jgi:hypothetical protein
MSNHTSDIEYEASLKSIETENYPDQWFYRPIGFRIAKLLCHTGITPNMITILSIFVGAAAGPLFYQHDRLLILLGIISLIIANILDCVDGQLARLTGIKSEIGRILDGIAGDIWFILIYVFLALKLENEYGGNGLFFIPAVLSGLSHLVQANITDYYKTLHLYFISKEKGGEFQSMDKIRSRYGEMKNGPQKVLFFLYMGYTSFQEAVTPKLQQLLNGLRSKYGDDIPDDIRLTFRQKSKRLMKRWIDLMTFNGRTIVLFIVVLVPTGPVWLYFLYEILVLNIVLAISIHKHEKICASFADK